MREESTLNIEYSPDGKKKKEEGESVKILLRPRRQTFFATTYFAHT
jgi:hypothetical protein